MQATNEPARRRSVNTLVSFPRTNYIKKVLVTAALPCGTACSVTSESLIQLSDS